MIKIADLINSLSKCLEAQRQLEQCGQHATGDADYYCYSYAQALKQAEENLGQTLNAYVDQRVAAKSLPHDLLPQAVVLADVAAAA